MSKDLSKQLPLIYLFLLRLNRIVIGNREWYYLHLHESVHMTPMVKRKVYTVTNHAETLFHCLQLLIKLVWRSGSESKQLFKFKLRFHYPRIEYLFCEIFEYPWDIMINMSTWKPHLKKKLIHVKLFLHSYQYKILQ